MQKIKYLKYSVMICFAIVFTGLESCKEAVKTEALEDTDIQDLKFDKLFSTLTSKQTNVDFKNQLVENINFNYYQYMYSYIGAGVAAGDFNNDGFEDLFFVSNTNESKLYKNKGDLVFEEVSLKASITSKKGFNTGVTTVDINNDGLLDIYIVRGGLDSSEGKFENLLYINQGDFKFKEEAKKYGLNDSNRGIQATFFDFDNDNDLDVFIANTPDLDAKTKEVIDINKKQKDPASQKLLGNDKLYENIGNGKFKDVSIKAGLHYDIGFGLNPQVGDLNGDGFLDIYVCNDFKVPDFAYINNGNGTFTDKRDEFFKHISHNSMGSDIVDINNDGNFDVLTLDMNPEDYLRSKTTMSMTSIPKFEQMVANNYHYQYMHNMVQVNNGNDSFSEVSNLSGMANTDWSWAVLAADLDLDGFEDVYVTNGVFRDVIDQDTTREILKILRKNRRKPTKEDFLKFAKMLPQQKLKNYFFKNNGDLSFTDTTDEWSTIEPTFSNGAIYVDLDNDGDLEVVTNNINEPASILKNNAVELTKGDFLKLNFVGPQKNRNGIGVKATVVTNSGKQLTRQLINTRGFLSSVSSVLHFGIPKGDSIAEVTIEWLDGKSQVLANVEVNKTLSIAYKNSTKGKSDKDISKPIFKEQSFKYTHKDPYFNDYKLQLLLPYKYSQLGPAKAVGDVNGDGIDDVFLGGGFKQEATLLLGTKNGTYIKKSQQDFAADARYEDISATFFDADNDGDLDLYAGSGSYEFSPRSRGLLDRYYENDGKGIFTKKNATIPELNIVTTVVATADYDGDGDQDVFVGSGVIPAKYPNSGSSYLLKNENGKFSIANREVGINNLGMLKDAVFKDIDKDGKLDLIVTGEWTGIQVLLNKNGKFVKAEQYKKLAETKGWWNKILVEDVDNDGDLDIIAGNLGLNTKFHANTKKPFHVYAKDFDANGIEDIVLAKDYKGKQVPVRGRTCTSQQMPHIAKKIPTFEEFANLGVDGILGKDIDSALHYEVNEFRSGIFYNEGEDFKFKPFSNEVQTSLVNSILYKDFDSDGKKDLLLAGNNHHFEVETTRSDAGIGSFLKGDGKGDFTWISNNKTGFFANKDVRHIVDLPKQKQVLVINNNDIHQLFRY
ncbi:VCBS repeat-containing protein [Aquimarina agarilytica]|uniref:VCBS repeat-containing protein n=1 Tax=Aquimarina agarilytica TaxID=1087449 RepID=UPI000289932E|nr:VCBS repeat-containing protein [Aquimarina agarilytica]